MKKKANQQLHSAYHQIEEKNNEILDSIRYAKRIQSAILPQKRSFKNLLPDSFVLYKPKGCATCTGGYKGRVGLFELLYVDKAIGDLIMSGAGALEIAKYAEKNGMQTIRKAG